MRLKSSCHARHYEVNGLYINDSSRLTEIWKTPCKRSKKYNEVCENVMDEVRAAPRALTLQAYHRAHVHIDLFIVQSQQGWRGGTNFPRNTPRQAIVSSKVSTSRVQLLSTSCSTVVAFPVHALDKWGRT